MDYKQGCHFCVLFCSVCCVRMGSSTRALNMLMIACAGYMFLSDCAVCLSARNKIFWIFETPVAPRGKRNVVGVA
jgi:hypothetical protein